MSTPGFEIDECKIITGSSDGSIRVADLNSNGKIISKFQNPEGSVRYLKMHESTGYLLMADKEDKIKLWDLRT